MKLNRAALLSLLLVSLLLAMTTSAGAQSPITRNGVGGAAAPDRSPLPAGSQPNALVTFDDVVAPCLFAETLPLRDRYADQGAYFRGDAGGGIVDECGNFDVTGHSSPNFLAFNDGVTFQDGSFAAGPERIIFYTPAATVNLVAGEGWGATGYIWMPALNTSFQPVGFDYVPISSQVQPLSIDVRPIQQHIFMVILGSNSSNGSFIVDNLSWEQTPWRTAKGDLDMGAVDSMLEAMPLNSIVESLLPD